MVGRADRSLDALAPFAWLVRMRTESHGTISASSRSRGGSEAFAASEVASVVDQRVSSFGEFDVVDLSRQPPDQPTSVIDRTLQ
jgi:hypothetical protein